MQSLHRCRPGDDQRGDLAYLEKEKIPYILGARMRKVKEIKEDVLSRAGRYREVHPEGLSSKDPSPLKVKEVVVDDRRYIVCLNERQARKDAADRQAIIECSHREAQEQPQIACRQQGLPEVPDNRSGHRLSQ